MAELGVLAYPVILGTMIAVTQVGRAQRWGSLEWLRAGSLALLLGLLVAVQVRFVQIGLVSTPLAFAALGASLAGIACLLGLYLWERWAVPARVPRLTATLRA